MVKIHLNNMKYLINVQNGCFPALTNKCGSKTPPVQKIKVKPFSKHSKRVKLG